MRTPLGPARPVVVAVLLACWLLAACGDGDDGHASDPATSSTPSSSTSPSSSAHGEVIAVVHAPASGMAEADPRPVDISTPDLLQAYARTLGRGTWAEQLQAAVDHADLSQGLEPYAAVISIGCDVPGAVITGGPGNWRITAAEVKDPLPECYVANMSVAVVALPA